MTNTNTNETAGTLTTLTLDQVRELKAAAEGIRADEIAQACAFVLNPAYANTGRAKAKLAWLTDMYNATK